MSVENLDEISSRDENKDWRCQNQKIFLTYAGHLDKIEISEFIKTTTKIKNPKFLRAAWETGTRNPEIPYEHTHVLIDFGKIFQSKNVRIFDFTQEKKLHPNIKFVVTKKHWEMCKKYIAKEDKDNADLLEEENNWVQFVCDQKTLADAITKCATKPTDVMGVEKTWKLLNKQEYEKCNIELRDWQKEVLEWISSPVDRKVNWIYDEIGGMGKSTFCDYLQDHLSDKVLVLTQLGGEKDCATILEGFCETNRTFDTIIIDFPRDAENRKVYGSLECFKNGRMTSIKYQGKTVRFNKCHVIVMANFPPEVEKMSMDRWNIRNRDWGIVAPLTLKRVPGEWSGRLD